MKKATCCLIVMVLIPVFSPKRGFAEPKDGFAAGIIVGEPTGITLKYKNFPVLGFARSFDYHYDVHCDYWVFHDRFLDYLSWYVGVGAKIRIFTSESKHRESRNEPVGAGIRVPVGFQYFFHDRFELFAEIVPGISVYPATAFDFDAGIGVRFYF